MGAANARTIIAYGRYTAPVDSDVSAAAFGYFVMIIGRCTANARAITTLGSYNTTVNSDDSADALRSNISTNTRSIMVGSSLQCAGTAGIASDGQLCILRHVQSSAVIAAFQIVVAIRGQNQIKSSAAFYSKSAAIRIAAHVNVHPSQCHGCVTLHHDFVRGGYGQICVFDGQIRTAVNGQGVCVIRVTGGIALHRKVPSRFSRHSAGQHKKRRQGEENKDQSFGKRGFYGWVHGGLLLLHFFIFNTHFI